MSWSWTLCNDINKTNMLYCKIVLNPQAIFQSVKPTTVKYRNIKVLNVCSVEGNVWILSSYLWHMLWPAEVTVHCAFRCTCCNRTRYSETKKYTTAFCVWTIVIGMTCTAGMRVEVTANLSAWNLLFLSMGSVFSWCILLNKKHNTRISKAALSQSKF